MLRSLSIIVVLWSVAFVVPAYVRADESRANLVKAELLADTTAVTPGKPFTVGVRLTVAPEWHVYWKNPGDAGLPIRVTWTLPEGYTAGELQFPVPIKFVQPGDIVGYGYEKEVMLLTTVTPPAKADATAKIAADVKWLVCKDVCIPGKTTLTLDLPVSSESKEANTSIFEQWRSQLPAGANGPFPWKAIEETFEGSTGEAGAQTHPRVALQWFPDAIPTKVELFFPADEALSFSDETITTDGAVTTVTYKQVELSPPKSNPEALVVITDSTNVRRGYPLPLSAGFLVKQPDVKQSFK